MKKAPGPDLSELLVRSLKFETRSFELDQTLRERFGDVVRINWPEVKHLLYHPKDFEHVLKDNAVLYRRGTQLGQLLGKSIATSEGDYWKRQKRILGREFHHSEFDKYSPQVISLADELVHSWSKKTSVNVSDEFMEFTFKVASQTLFGSETSEAEVESVKSSIKTLSDFAIRQIYSTVKLPAFVITPAKLRAFYAGKKIQKIIERIVRDFRERGEHSDNVLMRLMKGREENLLTDEQLKSEIFTLLLAGHETTSNALTWCLYELARNPKYQEEAYSEIRDVIGKEVPTLQKVSNLKTIDLILKETMRLYPPFPLLSRTANQDDEIRGLHVPKDSRVYCMTFVSHRRPDLWRDPHQFMPERFEKDDIHPYGFLPFGGGSRKCIGADFAMLEMKLLLTRIIQTFTFNQAESKEVRPRALVTLVPEQEVVLALVKRSDS